MNRTAFQMPKEGNAGLLVRLALLTITFVGYFFSVAPTVSLWDCGEFIASIHRQGIPHPPGTPFFMLLGKAWEELLFFVPHVAQRINWLSAMSSIGACFFAFEVVRILLARTGTGQVLRLSGAFLAASALAFSDTFWFNAVEAEVYGLAMMEMLVGVWLVLLWDMESDEGKKDRLLLLYVYLSFLFIGSHMYSMLTFPFVMAFVGIRSGRLRPGRWTWSLAGFLALGMAAAFIEPMMIRSTGFLVLLGCGALVLGIFSVKEKEVRDLRFWVVMLLLATVISFTKPFLLAGLVLLVFLGLVFFPLTKRNAPRAALFFWVLSGLAALGTLIWILPYEDDLKDPASLVLTGLVLLLAVSAFWTPWKEAVPGRNYSHWNFFFLLFLVAGIGYSTHLYLPIRSAVNPIIDENNPESWEKLRYALERKQYQSEGMLTRMFYRRGQWINQLGVHRHMGYLGYHTSQLMPAPLGPGKRVSIQGAFSEKAGAGEKLQLVHNIFWQAVLLLVLWASWKLYRSQKDTSFALIAVLFLAGSVGLILYINFSDGTRIEQLRKIQWESVVKKYRDRAVESGRDLPPVPNANLLASSVQLRRELGSKRSARFDATPEGRAWQDWQKINRVYGFRLPEVPRPVHLEVRDRDYFFTPGFLFFILLLAITGAHFLQVVALSRKSLTRNLQWGGAAFAALFWILPFSTHFSTHTRSKDYIARDFAHNLLSSVPLNGFLFTNGDNDTFPLWYLQAVEYFRTDVTVVNFSLANSDWYIESLQRYGSGLELPFPVDTLNVRAYRSMPYRKVVLGAPEDSLVLEYGKAGSSKSWRMQDLVLGAILEANYGKRPVCFTMNTNPASMMGFGDRTTLRGMVRCIDSQPGFDLMATDSLLLDTYLYTYVGDEDFVPPVDGRNILASYRRLFRAAMNEHIRKYKKALTATDAPRVQREKKIIERYMTLGSKLFPEEKGFRSKQR